MISHLAPRVAFARGAAGTAMNLPRVIDLGDLSVTLLAGGRFRLDGGAMFGIIPKTLWSRQFPADAENHIHLACNCLLLEGRRLGGRRVIVETGHGSKYGEKEQGFFAIDPANWLLPALRRHNIDPATITDVILTHLHFDHAGGATMERDGALVPTFPEARVHVQRREHDDARANFGIMTNTYREENFKPIDIAGAWRLLDGEGEILPRLRAVLTPGHTRGHHSFVIEGSERTLVFSGDVMPTARHVGRAWNMGYDLFPLDNRDSKSRLLKLAAERGWLVALDHEPDTPVVSVTAEKEWYVLQPA